MRKSSASTAPIVSEPAALHSKKSPNQDTFRASIVAYSAKQIRALREEARGQLSRSRFGAGLGFSCETPQAAGAFPGRGLDETERDTVRRQAAVNDADAHGESPHACLPWTTGYVLDHGHKASGGDRLRQIDNQGHTLGVGLTLFEWHVPNCMDFSQVQIEQRQAARFSRINPQHIIRPRQLKMSGIWLPGWALGNGLKHRFRGKSAESAVVFVLCLL